MKPLATYRIQLNKKFDFYKLREILPYLSELGISHLYASPIFKARRGSNHGYDITDSNKINEELGGLDAFNDLLKEANSLGLEWIQDIVPNHISYSPESSIVSDVMKQGFDSKYKTFLDVDWNHPSKLRGKILAPFLDEDLDESTRKKKIKLQYQNGFQLRYGNTEFPIKFSSYKNIIKETNIELAKSNQNVEERLLLSTREIIAVLDHYNNDFRLMKKLLSEQIYLLSNWRKAAKEINYRRFFDISDLICLRMEDNNVFETTHQLIQQLLLEKKIAGLRVDHIDGLYDPVQYLKRLRKLAPNAYVIAEKILLKDEKLPPKWLIEGTTGYEFLNQTNRLYIASENEGKISKIYSKFTGNKKTFENLLYKNKKKITKKYFAGDTKNLARLLCQALKNKAYAEKCSPERMREAIIELLSNFPVYRTYFDGELENNEDYRIFGTALNRSKISNKKIENELNAIERLVGEQAYSSEARHFIMRFQQFTGPIMAKGLEDTTFYIYNRLLSLNEVGSNPNYFGGTLRDFHNLMNRRQSSRPFSLNATATHDTKRGEDCRARINVLSEIPNELSSHLEKWSKINFKKKNIIAKRPLPNKNEEYYIYQTLIGSFPFKMNDIEEYKKRLELHIAKALREAKVNSNWFSPNLKYEKAVAIFVDRLLEFDNENDFFKDFLPFQKRIAFFGFIDSLSQTLIKITSPGVPDFFQGTELWDLNLVDPDNRRPVDFEKRQSFLKEIHNLKPLKIQGLLENFENGKIKLFEISKALETRRKMKELFQNGTYIPLEVKGVFSKNLIAYSRKNQSSSAIIIAPRFLTNLTNNQRIPIGDLWKDTFICLPNGASKIWLETFTEESVFSKKLGVDEGFFASDLLHSFPLALLLSGDSKT